MNWFIAFKSTTSLYTAEFFLGTVNNREINTGPEAGSTTPLRSISSVCGRTDSFTLPWSGEGTGEGTMGQRPEEPLLDYPGSPTGDGPGGGPA